MERSLPARPWVRTRVPSPPTVQDRLAAHGDARTVTRGAGSREKPHWSSHRGRRCGAGAHANSVRRHLAPPAIRRPGLPPPRGGRRARTVPPCFSVRRPSLSPPPSPHHHPHAGALQARPSPPWRALRPVGRSDPRKGRGHSPRCAHALSASRLRVGTRDAHPRVPSEATGR